MSGSVYFFYVPAYVEHNEFVERHIGSPTHNDGWVNENGKTSVKDIL